MNILNIEIGVFMEFRTEQLIHYYILLYFPFGRQFLRFFFNFLDSGHTTPICFIQAV